MEIKRLLSHFTYRIESNPAGGYIARASDPSVPPLEAPTREELQQKIQATIAATLAAEFPSLKPQLEKKELSFAFHIEHKPDGGFVLQSTDGKDLPFAATTHLEVQNKLAEKVLSAIGNRLMPEFSQALAKQADSGNINVSVKRNLRFATRFPNSGDTGLLSDNTQTPSALDLTNSPLTPEPNKLWPFVRFLLAAAIFAAIIYFIRYR